MGMDISHDFLLFSAQHSLDCAVASHGNWPKILDILGDYHQTGSDD